MGVKLAIVGSRSFADYQRLKSIAAEFDPSAIVSGGARGTDLLAQSYAYEAGLQLIVFAPEWQRYGRAAGPIRNRKIIQAADQVLAFWDGSSHGTQSAIKIAQKAGKPIHVVRFVAE